MTGIDAASSPFHRENLALPVKQKQHQLKFMLNLSSTRNSFSIIQRALYKRKLLKLHFVVFENKLENVVTCIKKNLKIQTGNQY